LVIRSINIRQLSEEKEENLSPYAVKSRLSPGRPRHEDPCPIRTTFQRDRDRIIHSKAFRRLKHKTQVFIAPLGDHYATRLTHTLEVSQIARTISRSLNLNEDLTEAIALGHDLGHTPFGHTGEDILNELYPKGFRHNEQSLRVIDLLENDGQGLNLSQEVRDGILNHSKMRGDISGKERGKPNTLEGEVCQMADAITYINHDIGDAVRAGIITERDLPLSAIKTLGISHSQRINTMVGDIIDNSWSASGYTTMNAAVSDTTGTDRPVISLSSQVLEATNNLREFLFQRVYNVSSVREEATRAGEVIRMLYHYLKEHEAKLPPEYRAYSDETERRVMDYIAGMTDQYALRLADGLPAVKEKIEQ
jgi:dGTPase